jgi:hypothetical protein
LVGVRWKAASAEEKLPYEEKAAVDKARYVSEKAAYDLKKQAAGEEESDADDKKKAKKGNKKDKNAPKRNSSAYLLFGADMRETIKKENPDIKPTEVMKELGTELL